MEQVHRQTNTNGDLPSSLLPPRPPSLPSFLDFFLERERKGEGERERHIEKSIVPLIYALIG